MPTIDFSKVVEFANGVRLINCTPHSVTFLDGDDTVVVEPSGATLLATTVETQVSKFGAAMLVRTGFLASPSGEAELRRIEREAPGVLILGSIISAQAYPARVVGMIPAPGFERVSPVEKRYCTWRFTTFQRPLRSLE